MHLLILLLVIMLSQFFLTSSLTLSLVKSTGANNDVKQFVLFEFHWYNWKQPEGLDGMSQVYRCLMSPKKEVRKSNRADFPTHNYSPSFWLRCGVQTSICDLQPVGFFSPLLNES